MQQGNLSNVEWFRGIGEWKIDWGPGYRIYLAKDGERIIVLLDGDPDTAKLILRDLVNATVGFETLAAEVHKPSKSLHRMLSKSGNPTMTSLSAIQRILRVEIKALVTAT